MKAFQIGVPFSSCGTGMPFASAKRFKVLLTNTKANANNPNNKANAPRINLFEVLSVGGFGFIPPFTTSGA